MYICTIERRAKRLYKTQYALYLHNMDKIYVQEICRIYQNVLVLSIWETSYKKWQKEPKFH